MTKKWWLKHWKEILEDFCYLIFPLAMAFRDQELWLAYKDAKRREGGEG